MKRQPNEKERLVETGWWKMEPWSGRPTEKENKQSERNVEMKKGAPWKRDGGRWIRDEGRGRQNELGAKPTKIHRRSNGRKAFRQISPQRNPKCNFETITSLLPSSPLPASRTAASSMYSGWCSSSGRGTVRKAKQMRGKKQERRKGEQRRARDGKADREEEEKPRKERMKKKSLEREGK